jgi:hypothetical protein
VINEVMKSLRPRRPESIGLSNFIRSDIVLNDWLPNAVFQFAVEFFRRPAGAEWDEPMRWIGPSLPQRRARRRFDGNRRCRRLRFLRSVRMP